MATDLDRITQAMQHVMQLTSLRRSQQEAADNQAQQRVAPRTIYTRTETPSSGLAPKQNKTVQPVAKTQTQPSAGQGDDKSKAMPPRPRTSRAPNRSLIPGRRGNDPKTPPLPNQKATGLRTEIDAKAEQRQGVKKTSHDNNSSVPQSKTIIIRPSKLTAENLPRMEESVPKKQEVQQASAKKDITDIFGLGGSRGRSNSPFMWYKNPLVKPPIPCKPEVMVQVLLSPRQLRPSCESLQMGTLGEGDNV